MGHAGDEAGLDVGDPPLATVGLDEPHDRDVVVARMEQVHEQPRHAIDGRQVLRRDKRMLDPVAGGADHDIECRTAAIGKHHVFAREGRDVARRREGAGIDPGEQFIVDDRV